MKEVGIYTAYSALFAMFPGRVWVLCIRDNITGKNKRQKTRSPELL